MTDVLVGCGEAQRRMTGDEFGPVSLATATCWASSSSPSTFTWGRCCSGVIELSQYDSGGTKCGTETSPTAHAGRIPQPSGASAPALWEALELAAGITGEDAQRRVQGRRSGSERWQQALKILLVDASAQLMFSSALGLDF